MENKDTNEEKRVKKNIRWTLIFLFIFAIIMYRGLIWALIDSRKANSDTNSKLLKEQYLNSTCNFKRDSLYKEVQKLSIYKSLTKAMVHRDEATSLLRYNVGDFVYMKRDSSKVVISDIIIGGSKYEYYVKYKVLHKDNSTEEVIPELVY